MRGVGKGVEKCRKRCGGGKKYVEGRCGVV